MPLQHLAEASLQMVKYTTAQSHVHVRSCDSTLQIYLQMISHTTDPANVMNRIMTLKKILCDWMPLIERFIQ